MSACAVSADWRVPKGEGAVGRILCEPPALLDLHPETAWRSARDLTGSPRAIQRGVIACWEGADLLFGSLVLDERDFRASPGSTALQGATEAGYRALFACLASAGYPHLARVWNYLPRINAHESGSERYRQFNCGRQAAFLAAAQPLAGSVPAACALGARAGGLRIGFLATRTPARVLENPRQVSAYDYPPEYGPRSPTFARATLVETAGVPALFVSGTAAIVGHRSRHPGDVVAQTRETIVNLETMTAVANAALARPRFRPDTLEYVVYLRAGESLPAVASELERWLGREPRRRFMVADICRRELLVEIEANSRPDTQGSRRG